MTGALHDHLQTGATHLCQCWAVTRRDGRVLGFTDHDNALRFDGITFAATSGLSARALASTSGLSVNNTEAMGVLSSDAITEADIAAGRYDGAEVHIWQVRWDDVAQRKLIFRGNLGEITRAQGGFQAELHGLTERLNQPQGRTYLKSCNAVLGDGRCKVTTNAPAFSLTHTLTEDSDGQRISLTGVTGYQAGWFTHGQVQVQSGAAGGLSAMIKADEGETARLITLWSPIGAALRAGDTIRLIAGCDKAAETCRVKFSNFLNYRGFPDIPGDDWLVSVPRSSKANRGGSLFR